MFQFMKIEYSALTKFLIKEERSRIHIKQRLDNLYGDLPPAYSIHCKK